MAELELEPESHVYTLDGVKIPGCTQVLAAMGTTPGFTWLSPEQLEFYRGRGRAVHGCVEYSIKGALDRRSIDPAIRGYLIGWERARKDLGIEVLSYQGTPFVETILTHSTFRYGVKPDIVALATAFNDTGVIEIKATSAHGPATGLQTAAQLMAVRQVMPKIGKLRIGLRLMPEEPYYDFKVYDERSDEAAWISFFNSYVWLQSHKLLKENK